MDDAVVISLEGSMRFKPGPFNVPELERERVRGGTIAGLVDSVVLGEDDATTVLELTGVPVVVTLAIEEVIGLAVVTVGDARGVMGSATVRFVRGDSMELLAEDNDSEERLLCVLGDGTALVIFFGGVTTEAKAVATVDSSGSARLTTGFIVFDPVIPFQSFFIPGRHPLFTPKAAAKVAVQGTHKTTDIAVRLPNQRVDRLFPANTFEDTK